VSVAQQLAEKLHACARSYADEPSSRPKDAYVDGPQQLRDRYVSFWSPVLAGVGAAWSAPDWRWLPE
jgi:hypothetical protein